MASNDKAQGPSGSGSSGDNGNSDGNNHTDGGDHADQSNSKPNGHDEEKQQQQPPSDEKDKQPEGGYDSTPLHPSSEQTYCVRITFHRATNLPVADYGTESADPYILAQVTSSQKPRHEHDPFHRFRSKTIHRNTNPEWESEWVIGGVPASGLSLSARIYDEDPEDHDDRLGKVEIDTGRISDSWQGIKKKSYKVHKTGADVPAYALRWLCLPCHRGRKLHASLELSIEVLGKMNKEDEVGKTYTMNNFWWRHYSPMIGRIAGVKSKDTKGAEKYNFQANQMQLRGPVPNELYHRYVDFKSFVGGMFNGTGARGTVLHKALHHQHERIYNYNKQTEYGSWPFDVDSIKGGGKSHQQEQQQGQRRQGDSGNNGDINEKGKEGAEGAPQGGWANTAREMTLKFLELVHFDQGGRIFTYVFTLDGMFRFTETGKEFGIDLLSKHTMHSDVNIYIAWSGEFLIRRVAHPDESPSDPDQRTHPAEQIPGGPPNEAPPKDPRYYELVIDNDSGTYRPNADLLDTFHGFLQSNFPGLKILVKSCTDKELDKIKDDQKKVKGKEGDHMVVGQGSRSGSISSSDAESLEGRANAFDDGDEGGAAGSGGKLEQGVGALENPKSTLKGALGIGKGKEEREHAEERDDQAS